jgi:hypothetical protein
VRSQRPATLTQEHEFDRAFVFPCSHQTNSRDIGRAFDMIKKRHPAAVVF